MRLPIAVCGGLMSAIFMDVRSEALRISASMLVGRAVTSNEPAVIDYGQL
jgi:hypothetical protein